MTDNISATDPPGKRVKVEPTDEGRTGVSLSSRLSLSQIVSAHHHNEVVVEQEMLLAEQENQKNSLSNLMTEQDIETDEDDSEFDSDAGAGPAAMESDVDSAEEVVEGGYDSDSSLEAPQKRVLQYVMLQQARGVRPAALLRRYGYAVENVRNPTELLFTLLMIPSHRHAGGRAQ